jgi:hypothetical protein
VGPAEFLPLTERVAVCPVGALVICSISFDQNRRLAVAGTSRGGVRGLV